MTPRSTSFVIVLALALLSAGCIAGGPGESSPTATDATETDGDTETEAGTTPTTDATGGSESPTPMEDAPYWERVADQPKPNQTVTLENGWERNATVRVRVVRNATGDVVHDRNYTLAPGAERDVYDTATADPDGIEEFTVVVTGHEFTERTSVWTNGCYDGVSLYVADGDSVRTTVEYANAEVQTDQVRGTWISTVQEICQG